LAKIRALRERLEAEQRVEQGVAEDEAPRIDDKEQRSFADGDARMMLLKRREYAYAYNAQAAADAEHGIIVAADLTNVAPDEGHLPALLEQIRGLRSLAGLSDQTPTTASADAGYFSHANAAEDGRGLDLLIAAGREDPAERSTKASVFSAESFGYDPVTDTWVCPAGARLERTPAGARGRPSKNRYHADPAACAVCPLRLRCLTPGQDRRVLVVHRGRAAGAMRFKLRQPAARRRYSRRKVIIEPIFGQLKEDRGFTTLSLRGLVLARAEYLLACLAHNLGKLLRVCALPAAPSTTA
jgi:transposase